MHQIIQSSREIHVAASSLQYAVQNFLEQKGVWNGVSSSLTGIYYRSSSQDNELKTHNNALLRWDHFP